ncbi:MAG: hypothetical protein CME24_06745 [Gemmatimonadetes bacterium]|nr:hypothetical protein [Gemmatimonadota bacterium]
MFIFGLIDNGILLVCLLAGAELEDYLPLPRRLRTKAAGAALGALVGNAISDGVAGLSMGPGAALSVTLGCLVVIPALALGIRRLG